MIQFVAEHPAIALLLLAALVGVATILQVAFFSKRSPGSTSAVTSIAPLHFPTGAFIPRPGVNPQAFWQDEIRRITETYGSPVKAAIQIERSIDAQALKALSEDQLQTLHNYWMEISYWCGEIRVELYKLDPEREWSLTAWTRLFNVFGRVNLIVQIAWSERFHPS